MANTDYDCWHRGHSLEDDIATPWHDFVKNNLTDAEIEGKRVLEIGCGRGGFSNYLAHKPAPPERVYGCDYSESALAIARQKYDSVRITWKAEDIMALSFEDNFFDIAVSCETIEHVPHSAKALSELFRVLKPGGKLVLTCPNYFNPFGIWCLYRWIIGKPFTEGGQPYVNYLQMPLVYWWLKKAGFRVGKFTSTDLTIPARVPKHYYLDKMPFLIKPVGHRTFYTAFK
jgi:ubiquinone/menaquinone biosynthesis C-methylase UbiE